jgi:hypothetical protein
MAFPFRRGNLLMFRIVHNLGGCGGTLLSRCLGVLPSVALLSEINPLSVKLFDQFNPLFQDRHWLHLLGNSDIERFSNADLAEPGVFRELIQVFHDRCETRGISLVLRDYNYIDFIGVPFIDRPPRRRILCDALPPHIPVRAVALIRHPIDQWLSLCKHTEVNTVLTPSDFLAAYLAFLSDLGDTPVFRYEDFVRNPAVEMSRICENLDLEFDPSCVERFADFDNVTGDFSRQKERDISFAKRKAAPTPVIGKFSSDDRLRRILAQTDYSLPP